MIEALVVTAAIGILGVLVIFAAKIQIAKGRDARRKSDLAKIQKALEDYMNDNGCYPDSLSCGVDFKPYFSAIPCDPINNSYFNYFYSYDEDESCKSWYKIYTRLEYTKDPIIEKVGCKDGCGPSGNYNYWVSSPNMNEVGQTDGELWWPEIGGEASPTSAPPTTVPTTVPTTEPTTEPTTVPTTEPSATPTCIPDAKYYGCFSGECRELPDCHYCSPNYINIPDCLGQCVDKEGNPNLNNQCN